MSGESQHIESGQVQLQPTAAANQTNTPIERLRQAVNNPFLDDLDRHIRSIHIPGLSILINRVPSQQQESRPSVISPNTPTTPTTRITFPRSNNISGGSTVIDIESPVQIIDHSPQQMSSSSSSQLIRRRSTSPLTEHSSYQNTPMSATKLKSSSESTIVIERDPNMRNKSFRSVSTRSDSLRRSRRNSNDIFVQKPRRNYDGTRESLRSPNRRRSSIHTNRPTSAIVSAEDADMTAPSNTTDNAANNVEQRNQNAGGTGTQTGRDSDEVPANVRELRRRIYELFRNRRNITQRFIEWLGTFPSLYLFASFFCIALLLIVGVVRFLELYGFYLLVLVFAFAHYSDSARFVRSGANIFGPLFVLLRYVFIIYLCQHYFIFQTAIFQPEGYMLNFVNKLNVHQKSIAEYESHGRKSLEDISPETGATPTSILPINETTAQMSTDAKGPSLFATLYIVIVTELFIMDIALLLKYLISFIPFMSMAYKRRLYQWVEYSCAMYRFPIPYSQWIYYFGGYILTPMVMIYTIIKVFFASGLVCLWLRTTWQLFSLTHIGTKPTESEVRNEERCSICHCDFTAPIKLNCGHIFCTEDIRTWLDKEVTCPVCRAVVTKEDNKFRSGESMFPLYFF